MGLVKRFFLGVVYCVIFYFLVGSLSYVLAYMEYGVPGLYLAALVTGFLYTLFSRDFLKFLPGPPIAALYTYFFLVFVVETLPNAVVEPISPVHAFVVGFLVFLGGLWRPLLGYIASRRGI